MKWVLAEGNSEAASALVREGLHPLVARLLVNRGITAPGEARAFLDGDLSRLSSPKVFGGMATAVARVRQAIDAHEKVVVYGDYDVDGVSGSALLYLALKDLGARVESYIPDRMAEGYGLNRSALEKIRASGAGLVITVDCGISAIQEAEAARSLGLDLIITDHHEITSSGRSHGSNASDSVNGLILPDALSILHPLLLVPDVPEPVRVQLSGLTGVGVAFKLAQELLGLDAEDARMKCYLDLVTLGTVADVGRILGENRLLVKHGLELLSRDNGDERPGVSALKQVARLSGKKITAGTVGFTLAPRINASGRLESAETAFRLLTTESRPEALELATALDRVNRERQAVEEGIQDQARNFCRQYDLPATGAFVLASTEWHPGVIGIVASRIVEEFYRPTALICVKNGVGKGSARSIPGFDLYHGLVQCADLLLGFGGHKYAAGFSIAEDRIPAFRERLGSFALRTLGTEGFIRTQTVDVRIGLHELTMELMQELDKMAPFGQGNPEPRLGMRGLEVVSSRIVGTSHLKLRLRQQDGTALDAIAFNRANLLGTVIRNGARLAAVITPKVNTWNGCVAVELEIKDLKPDQ
jgi:single-stranded-DNA-specific exonuclease